MHTKLYGRSDYLSTFCSGSFGHAKPTTQGVQYNKECRFKDKMNVKGLSIYTGIWPSFIGKSHTNECLISNLIDGSRILQNRISQRVAVKLTNIGWQRSHNLNTGVGTHDIEV